MTVKMGLFGRLSASNLQAAEKSLPHGLDPLALKLHAGRKMLDWGGSAARGLDSAAATATDALFSRGGALPRAGGDALQTGYSVLERSPMTAKALGVGLPLAMALQVGKADDYTMLANEAIQEGRHVLADDQSFLRKKIAEAKKTEKTAAGLGDFLNGMAYSGGQPTPTHPMMGALGTMMGSRFPGAMPYGAGQLTGSAMSGLGQIVGSGGSEALKPTMGTMGYRMNRAMNPLMTRVKGDELFATSFINNLGSEAAKGIMGLLKDVATKALTNVSQSPVHAKMVEVLQSGDPYLSRADPDQLSSAYHTMARFAPTLATDENAVRSFLRQAAEAGMGPDYASIKNLAESEKAVTYES